MPSAESVRVGLVGVRTAILPHGPAAVEITPADHAAVSRTSRKVQRLTNGPYWIPIMSGGGSYKNFDPDAEIQKGQDSNTDTSGNTIPVRRRC